VCKVAFLLAALLRFHFAVDARSDKVHILERLSDYCSRPMLALSSNTTVQEFKPYHWDFVNSVLFAITVVTTVGTSHSRRRSVLMLYEIVGECQTVSGRSCWAD